MAHSAPHRDPGEQIRNQVLPHFPGIPATARTHRFGTGLINQTFLVEAEDEGAGPGQPGRRWVLQRVNPMFPAVIQDNIEAVTGPPRGQGDFTPAFRTQDGKLCLDLAGDGIWRLFTHVAGISFEVLDTAGQARAAGALVGRFHRALDGLPAPLRGPARGRARHARHLARLREPSTRTRTPPGAGRAPLAEPLLARAAAAAAAALARADLPRRSQVQQHPVRRGRGAAGRQPVCLIDLDTVGPMSLAFELGDAWRSWCNRNGENEPRAALDLDVFRASLDGYRRGSAAR